MWGVASAACPLPSVLRPPLPRGHPQKLWTEPVPLGLAVLTARPQDGPAQESC